MKMSPVKAMTLAFIFTLVAAFVLAHFATAWNAMGIVGAAELAFWGWLGFMLPIIAGGYLWENKSFNLFVMNATYQLLNLFVIVLVLVLWL